MARIGQMKLLWKNTLLYELCGSAMRLHFCFVWMMENVMCVSKVNTFSIKTYIEYDFF